MGREPARRGGLKVLVTGGAGLVGGHLLRSAPETVDVEATWRITPVSPGVRAHRIDLTDAAAVAELVESVDPDVVIHTAYSIGHRGDIVDASANVAAACAGHDAALVHLSTDAVFSGERAPYGEDDPVEPVHDYGRWKAEAEHVVVQVVPDACLTRSSLVVSLDPPDGGTRWLVEAVRSGDRPVLFHDEVRSAIRAPDLAAAIWALVALPRSERAGIWHLPGPEALSRAELGRRVLAAAGLDPTAAKIGSSADHPGPRPRDLTLVTRRSVPGPAPSPVP